jgi:hypothetical protein
MTHGAHRIDDVADLRRRREKRLIRPGDRRVREEAIDVGAQRGVFVRPVARLGLPPIEHAAMMAQRQALLIAARPIDVSRGAPQRVFIV